MTISFLLSVVTSFMLNCYQTTGIITDVGPDNGYIVDANQNLWCGYASHKLEVGQQVKVVFYNAGTEDTIFDDVILQLEELHMN